MTEQDMGRVIVTGASGRSVVTNPIPYAQAEAGLPNVLDVFADDIRAGDVSVRLVREAEFQQGRS